MLKKRKKYKQLSDFMLDKKTDCLSAFKTAFADAGNFHPEESPPDRQQVHTPYQRCRF
jgi:hypothetical protein